MFRKRGGRRAVSLDLHETVLRALVKPQDEGEEWLLYEAAVPTGYVEDDIVKDEIGFFDWLKECLVKWNIKRDEVRYFVPDSSVMMKAIEHPENVETHELKGYVQMELGRSIQLPFENPLLDIYDPVPGDQKATVFAAPAEEVMRLANIIDDAHLNPTVADIRSLCAIRYFAHHNYFEQDKAYMLVEWLMTGVVVTIYRNSFVEFLRFQGFEKENGRYTSFEEGEDVTFRFDGDYENYQFQLSDQVAELERMMTFYRFSIHKGDIGIDEILSFGESPDLEYIENQMVENPSFPKVTTIKDSDVQKFYSGFGSSDISLIGLALKGDVHES